MNADNFYEICEALRAYSAVVVYGYEGWKLGNPSEVGSFEIQRNALTPSLCR